jgi:hypothetical protein
MPITSIGHRKLSADRISSQNANGKSERIMNETELNNDNIKPTLHDRLHAEAKRRAKELVDAFDLRDACHLELLGIDDDEEFQVVGNHVSRGCISVSFAEVNEAIGQFLLEKLPEKIYNQLIVSILSGEALAIDVTTLK